MSNFAPKQSFSLHVLGAELQKKKFLAPTKALKDAWETVRSMRTGENCPMAMAVCQCHWHMMGGERRF